MCCNKKVPTQEQLLQMHLSFYRIITPPLENPLADQLMSPCKDSIFRSLIESNIEINPMTRDIFSKDQGHELKIDLLSSTPKQTLFFQKEWMLNSMHQCDEKGKKSTDK